MGWSLATTLLVFTVVSITFITFGGIKAVVWAGAYQTIIYFFAGGVLFIYLLLKIQGGLSSAWHIASEAGRLSIFKFDFDLNNPTTFWAGTANAFFIGLAVFGTDQALMQRLLTVKTRRSSQKAIIATILVGLPILCLYLGIGTLLYVFYRQNPGVPAPEKAKEVFSHFVTHSLSAGLKGLMLSAIVLTSVESPLNSLSSSFVTDIYRPLIKKSATESHYLFVSRIGVIMFGLILAIIAFACQPVENILWFAFEIMSLTGGATLGIFLLGVLTKRKANIGNAAAMIISALSMTALLLLSHGGYIKLAWSWLIVAGTVMTFVLGYLFSFFGRGLNRNSGEF